MKSLGPVSSLPEQFGADVIFPWDGGFVGIQRKEYSDLLASLHDGRLAKEMGQMHRLRLAFVLIEGRPAWTSDGAYFTQYGAQQWTVAHHHALMYSLQQRGCWVDFTDSIDHTVIAIRKLEEWVNKARHDSLARRPTPGSAVWGKASSRQWALHLLQGFDGIGTDTAESIIEHFGRVPLKWDCEPADLLDVPGVGRKRAKRLWDALQQLQSG